MFIATAILYTYTAIKAKRYRRDCFVLLYDEPLERVLDGLTYLNAVRRMHEVHDDDWFCDQGELPF